VGAGAHADSEYVDVGQLIPRTRLLAELITRTVR
jgi:glutamate carboxypeptidase